MTAATLQHATVTYADAPGPPMTYLLVDVAKMINVSWRRLRDTCVNNDLDHVHAGGRRSMTPQQIEAAIAYFSTGVKQPNTAAPVDPLERVREATRRAANRQTPRRLG